MSKAAELAALIGSQTALSNRNLIINGAMQVAQRGTSATVGPNGTGEGYTTVDRFENQLNGSVVSTFTKSTDAPPGFANSAKFEITTADSSLSTSEFWQIRQPIEGQNLQSIDKGTSGAKFLTASFWVKSNKTGTYTAELQDVDNFRSNSLAYTIDSSDTWEHKTLTFSPDTSGAFNNDNLESVRLTFWLVAHLPTWSSGTFYNGTWGATVDGNRVHSSQVNLGDTVGNEWYITGVQLEVGEQATPFEHRSFADELARCQRYYQISGSSVTNNYHVFPAQRWNATGVFFSVPITTSMRTTPTLGSDTASNFGYLAGNNQSYSFALSEMTFINLDPSSITARVTVDFTPNNQYAYSGYFNAGGELQLDAEL